MPRIAVDLNDAACRAKVDAICRFAPGLVPGEANQGLTAEVPESPARLAEYDDSWWEEWANIRAYVSRGFTFAWWRFTLEIPESIDGAPVSGSQVIFETNIDDYGEVWVDGAIDLVTGTVAGFNRGQRVVVSRSAEPGTKHVIACLGVNGPFAKPGGGVWMRYATLAFESPE